MAQQLKFDALRWCKTMAKAHWQRNEFDILFTFHTVAEEIDTLRARVARLEEALRFILDECDWEESMSTVCGDNRIGVAARRALEEK